MAEAVSLLEEQDPCRCSICLDPLKDPATIPCGHNYCMKCISGFWDQKGEYSCPQCRETFTTRPVLKKNTTLAELVEKMKKISWSAAASPIRPAPAQCAEVGNVQCDFCTETKLKAIKSCLVCLVSLCQAHIEPHYSIPALKNHKLVQASTHLQQKICSQHNKLIEVFCRVDQECICMQCSMEGHKGHDTVYVSVARKEREQNELDKTRSEYLKRIEKTEQEVLEMQEAVASHQHSAKEAEQQSEKIFTELLESIERRRSEVKELIRAQQKAAVRDAEDVLEKLEQELAELRRGNADLEKLSVEEDHVNFLQSFQVLKSSVCKPSPSNNLSPHMSFEDLSKSLAVLKSEVEELCKQHMITISGEVASVEIIVPQEPKTREEFLKHFSELTMDPNTAHREICLSEGKRRAKHGKAQSYPCHPNRFTKFPQVLCEQGFYRRVFWEVELDLKNDDSIVEIAVAYQSIKRGAQGVNHFGNGKNSWSLACDVRGCRFWHNEKKTVLSVIPTSRIGVYVDHREGTLSFYNVSDTMTLLHKVKTSFTEAIYPGFHVGVGTSIKLCSEVEDV